MHVVVIKLRSSFFHFFFFFFSSRRRHTRSYGDWSSDVCSSDLPQRVALCRIGFLVVKNHTGAIAFMQRLRRVDCKPQGKPIERDVPVRAFADAPDEIGRASCRERVEISEGAGEGEKERDYGRWW